MITKGIEQNKNMTRLFRELSYDKIKMCKVVNS